MSSRSIIGGLLPPYSKQKFLSSLAFLTFSFQFSQNSQTSQFFQFFQDSGHRISEENCKQKCMRLFIYFVQHFVLLLVCVRRGLPAGGFWLGIVGGVGGFFYDGRDFRGWDLDFEVWWGVGGWGW